MSRRDCGRRRHRQRRRDQGGPPWRAWRGWRVVRGIHRRVLVFLFVAAGLGAVGGASMYGERRWVPLAVFAAMWPLAWAATLRIAAPVSRLADLASELREGRLSRREELKEGPDEVGEVAGALRGMADRVVEQLEVQRGLLAATSHELRSPLARVRVLVEIAREGGATEAVYDDLQAEVDGMEALIADLLAAARIDFEAMSPVQLSAADVARRALELAGLPESLVQAEPGLMVHADATLLARGLATLLDNARRHGGSVHLLRVRRSGEQVRFEVEDDGPGFAPGEEEAAFQPFWRRPGTARDGVGLGLALVRRIASWHDGDAGAENREEGGARVWLELAAT